MKNLTKLGEQIRHMSTGCQSDLSGGNLISRFHTFPLLHFTPIISKFNNSYASYCVSHDGAKKMVRNRNISQMESSVSNNIQSIRSWVKSKFRMEEKFAEMGWPRFFNLFLSTPTSEALGKVLNQYSIASKFINNFHDNSRFREGESFIDYSVS